MSKSKSIYTSIFLEVMTVKGYAREGYVLGRLDPNEVDVFIAPWYGPQEGFYSRLTIGTKVYTKKIPGESRLCHIIGIDRNTVEDLDGILNGRPNERILNTPIDPNSSDVCVFKRGSGKLLFSDEEISLLSSSNYGFKISKLPNSFESNLLLIGDSVYHVDNGLDSISGKAFISKGGSGSRLRLSIENIGNADESFFKRYKHLGFYPNNRVSEIPESINLPRNYNRQTFRHMGGDFVGFEVFYHPINGISYQKSLDYKKIENNPFNRHFFLPSESSFQIDGGIFSERGNEYDINFSELRYGSKNFKKSKTIHDIGSTETVFKRGVAHIFSTNSSVFRQSDVSVSKFEDNNSTMIHREEFTKKNLGKSSFYGNIPVNTVTSYSSSDVEDKNKKERIPIVFVKEDGTSLPKISEKSRFSGVRHADTSSNNVSGFDSEFRAKRTKYHNMVAAAEQLFATYPKHIINTNAGGTISSRFEYWYEDGAVSQSEAKLGGAEAIGELRPKATGSSYVVVGPSKPALKSGGSTSGSHYVAGKDRSSEKSFSNSFEVSENGKPYSDGTYESPGGFSMMFNAAGALIASIGKSDADGVSAIIDTEGGIVSWIGSDNNGRSITTQTDGSINICVGGPVLEEGSQTSFQKGRLELKVNVIDRGFVGSENSIREGDSDYRISISEKGLVISGGKKNSPMIISSNGDLNLESQHGNVNIVSNEGFIRYKTGSNEFSDISYRETESRSVGTYLDKAAKAAGVK